MEPQDLLLNVGIGSQFGSFEEVESIMKQLREELFYPLMFAEKKTVESHNKRVSLLVNHDLTHQHNHILIAEG